MSMAGLADAFGLEEAPPSAKLVGIALGDAHPHARSLAELQRFSGLGISELKLALSWLVMGRYAQADEPDHWSWRP